MTQHRQPLSLKIAALAIALSLICVLTLLAFWSLQYEWKWSLVFKYKAKFIDGWFATVFISLTSLCLSLIAGGVSALACRSDILPVRYLFKIYVELTRGTPLLVQILILFYVFADAVHIENRYFMGILILSLFNGAYVSEIFRAGIQTIGKSQLLSANAIGFTPYQIYRYVIAPQALRASLPALTGQFANLIKDSSLLSIIAISEFTLNAREVNSATFSTFEGLFLLALGYLLLTLPIMRISKILEKKVAFDT